MPPTPNGAGKRAAVAAHPPRQRPRRRPWLGLVTGALLWAPVGIAAQTASVAGTVRTGRGEPAVAAVVEVRGVGGGEVAGGALRRTTADSLGHYRLAGLAPGRYRVVAARIGLATLEREIELGPGALLRLDLVLADEAVAMAPVTVEVVRRRERFRTTAGASIAELTGGELKGVPGLAEADVLRAVEMLPGVVSTTDFSAAFNVRGGSADQNLILLDGFPIFNPFHLGGLFSVFNSDMVRRAELLAGGFPARYGGRVSSVLSVETDAGDGGLGAATGISLLASRLAAGADLPARWIAPFGLSAGRARISVRRSYFDKLLVPFVEFPYHLTDLQGYAEAWTEGGNRVAVTGYLGRDVVDFTRADPDDFPLRVDWGWGNRLLGARWSGWPGGGAALDLRAGFSSFDTRMRFPDYDDTRFDSRIAQRLLRADLTIPASPAVRLGIGAEANRLDYAHTARSGGAEFRGGAGRGWLLGGYGEMSLKGGDAWILEAGVRADGWSSPGAEVVTLSPRLAIKRFMAGGTMAVRLAAGRYSQHLHSLRDEELPLGIDVWVLAGDQVPVVVSAQYQLGVERFLPGDWYASLEGFWRTYDGVIANNLADDPNDPGDDIMTGDGAAYGADLFVRRDGGSWSGWFSISWLRATRTFPDVTSAIRPAPVVSYAPVFDRRIDLELVLRASLGRGVEAGAHWNYGTGLPYTRPLGSHVYNEYRLGANRFVPRRESQRALVLGERNAARYPVYHRLDLSVRRRYTRRWGTVTPYVQVVNVYNRKDNVLFYFFEYDSNPPTRSGVSQFPILPTIGVEASF